MQDKYLRLVEAQLLGLANCETMEPEQKEAILAAVRRLRRAVKSRDVKKMNECVEHIARIFIRSDVL